MSPSDSPYPYSKLFRPDPVAVFLLPPEPISDTVSALAC
jgi:hypothetical protein